MGYDQNGQNGNWNQDWDQNQWDRWNSTASNNSYYNQPTHTPYDQGFSIASLVMGILSVTLGCCGLSLPFGALGILFALLCYRKGKRLRNSNARFGLYLSIFGCVYGIGVIIYSLVQLPTMLNDPTYASQLNQIYQSLFGMDFQEFIQSFYGSTSSL